MAVLEWLAEWNEWLPMAGEHLVALKRGWYQAGILEWLAEPNEWLPTAGEHSSAHNSRLHLEAALPRSSHASQES